MCSNINSKEELDKDKDNNKCGDLRITQGTSH
jgi:hypothetical protein